ncbi:MAG: hypothetical protein V7L11_00405 [Nostoc sp.]|uniref:hypothetical protein n=1 Tax=Nostoc sp. TaxID=1180 RepID=UPI002FF66033
MLTQLANHLPPNLKQLGLSKALAAAKQIQHEFSRAKALSALADKLLPEVLPDALPAAKQIQDERHRADALSSLAEKLSQIQKTELFDHWRNTLQVLSLRTRPNLLSDIRALTPVIFALGDKKAVKDTGSN